MKGSSMFIQRLALFLASAVALGCGPPPIAPSFVPKPESSGRLVKAAQPVALPLHRPAAPDRSSLPAVVKANNAFAVDLYHAMRARPGNILVSPACLTAGLAMLRAGARGETAAEIDRALHRIREFTDTGLAALIQRPQRRRAGACLSRSAWPMPSGFSRAIRSLDAYRATLHDVFALDDERRVDFTGHPERGRTARSTTGSRSAPGGKIASVTRARLRGRPPTKMVLTSALYFRGNWVGAASTRSRPAMRRSTSRDRRRSPCR